MEGQLDQSFSEKNLRKVWDLQARRGRNRLGLYPDARDAYDQARSARKMARASARSSIRYIGPPENAPDRLAQAARDRADAILDSCLAATSLELATRIESDTFTWDLQRGPRVKGSRDTYMIDGTPEIFFADKHLQRLISSMSRHRAPSRQSVVSGLVRTLDNTLPKSVVRTDVAEFYESIDHGLLRRFLQELGLTPTNRCLIEKLLQEWSTLTGSTVGLPTGVGLSAVLAELYMAQADQQLRDDPSTLYYARYVDDIVLVQSQDTKGLPTQSAAIEKVREALAPLKLSLNTGKTFYREFENGKLPKFDFLGYEICHAGGVQVCLTNDRYQKLRERLERSFAAWKKGDPDNHGRRKLLLDRIRLLTGNTRLSHNKRNAMVGIYFSNPLITETKNLTDLDKLLTHLTEDASLPPELKVKIEELSFVDGFKNRTLHRWPTHALKKIRGAWS